MKPKRIIFDSSFEKKFTKYKSRLTDNERNKLRERFEIFKQNVFDNRLKTHKLKGGLEEYYAFSISYRDRLIFKLIDDKTVLLIEIGSHDICY